MTTGNQYDKKVSEQDILKVFDAVEAPVLTASDLAEEIAAWEDGESLLDLLDEADIHELLRKKGDLPSDESDTAR